MAARLVCTIAVEVIIRDRLRSVDIICKNSCSRMSMQSRSSPSQKHWFGKASAVAKSVVICFHDGIWQATWLGERALRRPGTVGGASAFATHNDQSAGDVHPIDRGTVAQAHEALPIAHDGGTIAGGVA
jgi:hypothetical protein